MIGTNSWDSSFLVPGQPSMAGLARMLREDPKILAQLYGNAQDKCIASSDAMGDMFYRGSTKFLADSMNGIAPGYAYYFDNDIPKDSTSSWETLYQFIIERPQIKAVSLLSGP